MMTRCEAGDTSSCLVGVIPAFDAQEINDRRENERLNEDEIREKETVELGTWTKAAGS